MSSGSHDDLRSGRINLAFGTAAVALLVAVTAIVVVAFTGGDREATSTATPTPTTAATPATVITLSPSTSTSRPSAPSTTVWAGFPTRADDPAGDSLGADLTSAMATADGSDLLVELEVAQTSVEPVVVFVYIDGDANPSTGQPEHDATCTTDPRAVGAEHFIAAGYALFGDAAYVATAIGGCDMWSSEIAGTYERVGSRIRIVVPRAALTEADDQVTVRFVAMLEASPGNTVGPADVVPDAEGLPLVLDPG